MVKRKLPYLPIDWLRKSVPCRFKAPPVHPPRYIAQRKRSCRSSVATAALNLCGQDRPFSGAAAICYRANGDHPAQLAAGAVVRTRGRA